MTDGPSLPDDSSLFPTTGNTYEPPDPGSLRASSYKTSILGDTKDPYGRKQVYDQLGGGATGATAFLNYIDPVYQTINQQWNDYTQNSPNELNITGDKVYKVTQTPGSGLKIQDPTDPTQLIDAPGATKSVEDPAATQLYRKLLAVQNDYYTVQADLGLQKQVLKDVSGTAGNVKTYLDTEKEKAGEVTRQLNDFLTRAKGVTGFQDDNQAYAMHANDQNMQQAAAVKNFTMDPGQQLYFGPNRPGIPGENTDFASQLGATLPANILPDYQLNGAVGLPGTEGFNPQRSLQGNPEDQPGFLRGYASGTPIPSGVPQDLAWMIGMPAVQFPPRPEGIPGPDQVYAQLGLRRGQQ